MTRLASDLLDRPLALREQVDNLRTPPAGQRCGDGRERIEEGGFRLDFRHMLKLSFEYLNVNACLSC